MARLRLERLCEVVACFITAQKEFYCEDPHAFDRQNSGMWLSVELLQNRPVLGSRLVSLAAVLVSSRNAPPVTRQKTTARENRVETFIPCNCMGCT